MLVLLHQTGIVSQFCNIENLMKFSQKNSKITQVTLLLFFFSLFFGFFFGRLGLDVLLV
jgi:hypothetical protein